jgi:magnesium transporter
MLTIHDFANATYQPWPGGDHLPEGATWVDANAPTKDESDFLERALGVRPPTLESMREIAHSSRFYRLGAAICLNIPLPVRDESGDAVAHPLTLALTPHALMTVRYEPFKPCSPEYLAEIGVDREFPSPAGALIGVLDGMIDHISDELEGLTTDLDIHSREVFAPRTSRRGLRGPLLQHVIAEIGRQRLFHSLMEEALLSLSRGVGYLESQLGQKLEAPVRAQFDRIKRDIESLAAHETRLSDKIQFLLDASLGLIAIEQNDIFKVLTVVSVIGIPPTLVASMYGMNFKSMPELDWPYGYAWGLCLIVGTALTPYLWFRWKRWI